MAVSSLGTPWVAGQTCLGWAVLLGVPMRVNFGPGGVYSYTGVIYGSVLPLTWSQTFVPRDTPWGTSLLYWQISTSLPGSLMGAAKSTRAGVWMGLWARWVWGCFTLWWRGV